MSMWDPWRGCRKYSEGCKYCYIHKGDKKRGVDTNKIVKTNKFYAPVERTENGSYKIPSHKKVYLCFSSDFFIEEADSWRSECWDMIKERSDLNFVSLTKRIDRFDKCIPKDWGDGYSNVTIGCTIENQKNANYRLSIFSKLPIKNKNIICQPLIERISIRRYLEGVELVIVGGESDKNARLLNYNWVLDIQRECIAKGVSFQFRQTGTHFIKDNMKYTISVKEQYKQARKANISYQA